MSGLFKGIKKVFKKVAKFVKRYWKQIVIAAAIVFTAGVAMGYFGAAAAAGGGAASGAAAAGAAGATAAGTATAGAAAAGGTVFGAAGGAAALGTGAGGALGMGTAGLMAGGTGAGLAAAGGGAALATGAGLAAGASTMGAVGTTTGGALNMAGLSVTAKAGSAVGMTLTEKLAAGAIASSGAGAFSHAAAASSPQIAEIQQAQQGQQQGDQTADAEPGSGEEMRDNPFDNDPSKNAPKTEKELAEKSKAELLEEANKAQAERGGLWNRAMVGKDGTGGWKNMSSFEKVSLLSTAAQMGAAAFAPKAPDGSFPMQEQFYGYNKDGKGPGTNVDYDARTGNMVMGAAPQATPQPGGAQLDARAGQPGHRPIPESFVARNEARNKELDDRMKFITGGG